MVHTPSLAVRHEFLEHLGLESVERLVASGAVLALSELHIRFLAPLRCGDAFIGTVVVTRAAGARVYMQQQLLREGSTEPQVCRLPWHEACSPVCYWTEA